MGAFRRRWPGLSLRPGRGLALLSARPATPGLNGWTNVTGEPKTAFRLPELGVIDVHSPCSPAPRIPHLTCPPATGPHNAHMYRHRYRHCRP